ncbi:MAG: GNAT family N-acetyltransferase [Ignavibacteria bacterium]|nr:GNAT family N-acetyltransferase [Ignavibacteria bacterium]
MKEGIVFRKAESSDSVQLSVLFKQVYIQTYDTEGVTAESSNYISRQFSVEKIEDTIIKNPGNIIVASNGGNLLGAAEIEFDNVCPADNIRTPELCKLYVLERFYGKGIGYGLLKEAEMAVISKGKNMIWLTVYFMNSRAIAFYERNGFKYTGDTYFEIDLNKYKNRVYIKELYN